MLDDFDFGEESSAGVQVSERSGMRQATVYTCINILSRDMSALPLKMYERTANGGRAEVTQHPLARWLKTPNPSMTPAQFRQRGWVSALTSGNDCSQVIRNPAGEIRTFPLDYSRLTPVVSRGVKRFVYDVGGGKQKVFRPDEVLHNFGLSFDGYVGVSPIRQCMETIGHAIAVGEYGGAYFKNPTPKTILKSEAGFKDSAAKAAFLEEWSAKFAGKKGLQTAAILPPGMDVSQIVKIPNDEAQFIETKKLSKEEIAQIYLVPMHRLQALDRATFSNIEHQAIEYVVYTLLPWLEAYEQVISHHFLTPEERERYFVRHNVDGLLRGDFKTRMEGHNLAFASGVTTINERRALENLPAVPGGDEPMVPLNFVRLSDLDNIDQPEPAPDDDERSAGMEPERRAATDRRRIAQKYVDPTANALQKLSKQDAEAIKAKAAEELRSETRTAASFASWADEYYRSRAADVKAAVLPAFLALAQASAEAAAREVNADDQDVDALVDAYADNFAGSWTRGAAAQLSGLAVEAEALDEDPYEAVQERVDEWIEGGQGQSRAKKAAKEEVFGLANAVALAVFNAVGLGARWITFGKNCPYCNSLRGKRVALGQSFVDAGSYQPEGAERPLKIRGKKKHPPIHRGCDCMVGPG